MIDWKSRALKAEAELQMLAATEPVARTVADTTNTGHSYVKVLVNELPFRTELFTRPMPAQIIGLQDVHDAVTADPTLANCAQDVMELVEALEKLARLGNGEHYGNSDGNMIARTALSKYKGAK